MAEEVKKTTSPAVASAPAIQDQYAQRQADAEKLYNQRTADANKLYDQRQANAQNVFNQRTAESNATFNQRQTAAQDLYNQRQAQAQSTYNQRLSDSENKISDLYAKALAAQQQQINTGLDKGIAAQEEARANIGTQFQTAANDLAVQYERNRRNLNMQALAQGLNTGTGSQQQLALNQGFAKGYAGLRAEEGAQNAGIDRTIANLKVDAQNAITQAIADNDYKKAADIMNNYNNQLAWLDQRQLANQNYLDQQNAANQNYWDTQVANNRNYLDSMNANNQNRLDTQSDKNMSRFDSTSDANRDWADNEQRYRDTQALQKAQTLASYGDFSGYESIYGKETSNTMKEMWIAQNPDMAYRTGQIDAERYKAMTGVYPAGYNAPSSGGGGGGWGGGGYVAPKASDNDNDTGKKFEGTGKGKFEVKVSENRTSNGAAKNGYVNKSTITPTAVNAQERYLRK